MTAFRRVAGVPCEVETPSRYRVILPDAPASLTLRNSVVEDARGLVARWLGLPAPVVKRTTVCFEFDGREWRITGFAPFAEELRFRTVENAAKELVYWGEQALAQDAARAP